MKDDADVPEAKRQLRKAIALHEQHMNGSAPTTGKDGEKSQMAMMAMMQAALDALTGDSPGAKVLRNPAHAASGMKM